MSNYFGARSSARKYGGFRLDGSLPITANPSEPIMVRSAPHRSVKSARMSSNRRAIGGTVEGPYVNGAQFVRFTFDMTPKATGQRALKPSEPFPIRLAAVLSCRPA